MVFEIWLGEQYGYFDHGIARLRDGSTAPLLEWIHTATYGMDSLLITDEERYKWSEFLVRWFIHPAGIELYGWDSEVEKIILHNESGKDLEVSEFGILRAGETLEMEGE